MVMKTFVCVGSLLLAASALAGKDDRWPTDRSLRFVQVVGSFDAIPPRAFAGYSQLTGIVIRSSRPIRTIGEAAFSDCTSLRADFRDLVPKTVVRIGENAFEKCGSVTGAVRTVALEQIGAFAFYASGVEDVKLDCADSLAAFPDGKGNWGINQGIFTKCPRLTNLVIRARGLTSLGACNIGDDPELRRLAILTPSLTDMGGGISVYTRMPKLETLELFAANVTRIGDGWPVFSSEVGAAKQGMKRIVLYGAAPEYRVLKKLLGGVWPVANDDTKGKWCTVEVNGRDPSWRNFAAELESNELKIAPKNCLGVYPSTSRRAWIVDRSKRGTRP